MVEELYECLVLLFTAFSVLSLFLMLKSMQCISVSIVAVVLLLICVQLFVTPCTIAHQTPLSMGFPRQEYWSGLPFPSPGHLPNPGIEPQSPALQADLVLCIFYMSSIYIRLSRLENRLR